MRTSRFQLVASVAALALATGLVAAPASAVTAPASAVTSPAPAATSPGTLAAAGFSDVDGTNPFAADIAWLADAGITTGYPDGTFRPRGSVNRDAMAAFLYRIVVGPDTPAACAAGPFSDVGAAHPFCPQITWLVGEEITTGWPDGTYRPAAPVSREAMAAFLYRVAKDGADAPACSASPFSDVPATSAFCGEIIWLATEEVTTGWPDGTFRPGAPIERQAMAAFLHRFVDKGLVPGDDPDPDPDPEGPAPEVWIDEPLGGSMVGGAVTVTASWSTSADLARIDLLVDDVAVASADTDPFELTWDTTTAAPGGHTLTLAATDADGLTGTSAPVAVFVHQGTNPLQLLEEDREAGTVTAEDYARYGVYRWFEPDLVPEQYRLPEGMGSADLTGPLTAALRDFDSLDPAVQAELQAYLSPDDAPTLPLVPLTEAEFDAALAPFIAAVSEPLPVGAGTDDAADDGLVAAAAGFALGEVQCATVGVSVSWKTWSAGVLVDLGCKYSTFFADFYYSPLSGVDVTVDVLDGALRVATAGGGPNGVPDAIDEIAAAYFDAARVYRDLGFAPIAKTSVAVGSFKNGGFSAPKFGSMFVDSSLPEEGTGGRVYLMRHELFHQIQYPYLPLDLLSLDYTMGTQTTTAWWLEATAEWASHRAQQDVGGNGFNALRTNPAFARATGRYAQRLRDHLGHANWALAKFISPLEGTDVSPQYGAFLFAEYLDKEYGDDFILKSWTRVRDGDRLTPIAAIAAELAEQGVALIGVVRAYHEANRDIGSSYELAGRYWAEVLGENGLQRTVLNAKDGEHRSGTLEVGPGGVFYLELVLPEGSPGALVRVQLDHAGLPASDVTIEADSYSSIAGWRCRTYSTFEFRDGGYDSEITLLPDCPEVRLMISHNQPGLILRTHDGPSTFDISYRVTAQEAKVAGLSELSAEVEFVGPERASVIDGIGDYGQLLDEDGYANYWGATETLTGNRKTITQVRNSADARLGGVQQIQSECQRDDNGWALTDDGRLWSLSYEYYNDTPEFSNVDHFALGWCGRLGYLVHRNGSLTYVNADTPAPDYTPVTGEADVTDVTALQSGDTGYAITGDRELLHLNTTTAVPVPGVDNVAAVTADTAGTAYVRRRDGTVVVFGRDEPLVPKPVAGIPSAREVLAPGDAFQGYVLTDTDRLFVVQCGDTACSEVTVLDSGLTGVDTVTAVENATATRPAWVLLRSGELVELYVDGSGVHTASTGLTDVVDIGAATYRHKVAVHADGTVSTWKRLETGWGPREQVAHVTNADEVLCTNSRCFVNLD